jgi:hypothetical protein
VFKEFEVSEIFRGHPVTPVLESDFAKLFRTRIIESARHGPNFAGKYTARYWGCGTSCIVLAVVNEQTGAVHRGPFRFLNYGGSIKYPDGSYSLANDFQPLSFHANSRLLIVRGCPNSDQYEACGVYYYEWIEPRFRLIEVQPGKRFPVGEK